jgi:hypothetical protein
MIEMHGFIYLFKYVKLYVLILKKQFSFPKKKTNFYDLSHGWKFFFLSSLQKNKFVSVIYLWTFFIIIFNACLFDFFYHEKEKIYIYIYIKK